MVAIPASTSLPPVSYVRSPDAVAPSGPPAAAPRRPREANRCGKGRRVCPHPVAIANASSTASLRFIGCLYCRGSFAAADFQACSRRGAVERPARAAAARFGSLARRPKIVEAVRAGADHGLRSRVRLIAQVMEHIQVPGFSRAGDGVREAHVVSYTFVLK